MIQLNILLLLVAFYKFLHRKKVKIGIFIQKLRDPSLELFHGRPEFNSSATLVK